MTGESAEAGETRTVTAGSLATPVRLDRFLALSFPDVSRSRIRELILNGHATVNEIQITDPSHRVKQPGLCISLRLPPQPRSTPCAQGEIPLDIVYEDADLLVIDKPAGLAVHPGAGLADGTLVNALLAHCGPLPDAGAAERPGIVHRLDKDTSGLLLAAKTPVALTRLQRMFAERRISRLYKAVARGVPAPPEGRVEGNIGRSPRNRLRMAVVVPPAGKPAATRYRVTEAFGPDACLLECRLETGRTHQIRVHMAHLGHPLLGDPLYAGRAGRKDGRLPVFARQALHAETLGFSHPLTGEEMMFHSPLPADMRNLLQILRSIQA